MKTTPAQLEALQKNANNASAMGSSVSVSLLPATLNALLSDLREAVAVLNFYARAIDYGNPAREFLQPKGEP